MHLIGHLLLSLLEVLDKLCTFFSLALFKTGYFRDDLLFGLRRHRSHLFVEFLELEELGICSSSLQCTISKLPYLVLGGPFLANE